LEFVLTGCFDASQASVRMVQRSGWSSVRALGPVGGRPGIEPPTALRGLSRQGRVRRFAARAMRSDEVVGAPNQAGGQPKYREPEAGASRSSLRDYLGRGERPREGLGSPPAGEDERRRG